jgi:two-component system, chemotaxis family, chemotaxis protein CheY
MDMVMPELSDVDAVRQIRALDRSARIVMCSAMGQQQLVTDALETGASGFITKPFTASRVLEALADLVGGAAV